MAPLIATTFVPLYARDTASALITVNDTVATSKSLTTGVAAATPPDPAWVAVIVVDPAFKIVASLPEILTIVGSAAVNVTVSPSDVVAGPKIKGASP